MEEHELVVVGGGPAGLSAAINAAYYKLEVLVLESAAAGGALVNQYPWKTVDNYLGLFSKTGAEVAEIMKEHAIKEGVRVREKETVVDVRREGVWLAVKTTSSHYRAKAVILACGLGSPRKLGVPGEELGGVLYSLPKTDKYAGKKVLVVGGGDSAVESAVEFKKCGAEVMIAHRKDAFRATEKNVACVKDECVNVLWNTEVRRIEGKRRVEEVHLYNNKDGSESTIKFDAVLFCLGTVANSEFLQKIGIKLDEKNNIIVNPNMQTNLEGVFAAGDVTGKWLRIPQAIGEGGLAGLNAMKYVKKPYWV